jgi:hypothetical protein
MKSVMVESTWRYAYQASGFGIQQTEPFECGTQSTTLETGTVSHSLICHLPFKFKAEAKEVSILNNSRFLDYLVSFLRRGKCKACKQCKLRFVMLAEKTFLC